MRLFTDKKLKLIQKEFCSMFGKPCFKHCVVCPFSPNNLKMFKKLLDNLKERSW